MNVLTTLLRREVRTMERKLKPKEVFDVFYQEHAEKIFKFVYYKVGNRELAEDLAAETFLKTWRYIEKNTVANMKSFVYRVANNLVVDHWRSKDKIPLPLPEGDDPADIPAAEVDLESFIDTGIDLHKVSVALERIHPQYKEIISLKYFDDLTTDEIADVLGKTKNNINVLIFRALKALKKTLEQPL